MCFFTIFKSLSINHLYMCQKNMWVFVKLSLKSFGRLRYLSYIVVYQTIRYVDVSHTYLIILN